MYVLFDLNIRSMLHIPLGLGLKHGLKFFLRDKMMKKIPSNEVFQKMLKMAQSLR